MDLREQARDEGELARQLGSGPRAVAAFDLAERAVDRVGEFYRALDQGVIRVLAACPQFKGKARIRAVLVQPGLPLIPGLLLVVAVEEVILILVLVVVELVSVVQVEQPESTLTTLKVRAARAGQSLQAYIRQLLETEATVLPPDEAADQARSIAARSQVTADDVMDAIAMMREERS